MIGYNDEALSYMLEKISSDEVAVDKELASAVLNLALTYDVDYMVSAGIIKDGEFTEEYYDDDDAFDFIAEHIANARPELDTNDIAEILEMYFDYHDEYMSEKGLLDWD